jgi:hypothetical protein
MGEVAGRSCVIKISGAAVVFTGEATTQGGGNTTYQITDTSKQVLDREEQIHVLVKGTNDTAESGTTTTNLKLTAHGLATGDVIINTSRANAKREVTYVDANNVTVATVTGQTTGDTIEVYKEPAAGSYTLNRLNGKATFGTALSRTVLMSGKYLPMSTAAYANKMSRADQVDILDKTKFGSTSRERLAGLLSASGTFSQFDVTDTTYLAALTAGDPIVIEDRTEAAGEPNRTWALLDSDAVDAAVGELQNEIISWVSYDTWLRLGV